MLYKLDAALIYAAAFVLIGTGRDEPSVISGFGLIVLALLRLVRPVPRRSAGPAVRRFSPAQPAATAQRSRPVRRGHQTGAGPVRRVDGRMSEVSEPKARAYKCGGGRNPWVSDR